MAASREKTIILNSSGEKLVGVLHDAGNKEIVILCHGLNSSKDCELIANFASTLLHAGITVFPFDFSGNGESEGEFQFGHYSKEVEDIRSVVLYWIKQGYKVKAIIGHSKGGSVVLLYASKYHDVHMIVNASGRLDLKDGLSERLGDDFMQKIETAGFLDCKTESGKVIFRVTRESLMERLGTDLHKAASLIPKNCRVLTVHGSKDEAVPVKNAFECDKLVPNHTLHVIDGADHMYTHHEKDMADAVIRFLQSGL